MINFFKENKNFRNVIFFQRKLTQFPVSAPAPHVCETEIYTKNTQAVKSREHNENSGVVHPYLYEATPNAALEEIVHMEVHNEQKPADILLPTDELTTVRMQLFILGRSLMIGWRKNSWNSSHLCVCLSVR